MTVCRPLSILVLATLALVAASAQAAERSGTVTIGYGDSFDVTVDFPKGSSMSVEYSVTVVQGPNVWVYFVHQAGYSDYNDPREEDFPYYESWSNLNVRSASEAFTLEEYNTYYLIIENSDESQRSTTVKYIVSYEADKGSSFALLAALSGVLLCLPLLLWGLYVHRRSRAPLPPPAPYEPGGLPGEYLPVPSQDDHYSKDDEWYDERRDERYEHMERSHERWERERSGGPGASGRAGRHGGSGRSNASPIARMRKRV